MPPKKKGNGRGKKAANNQSPELKIDIGDHSLEQEADDDEDAKTTDMGAQLKPQQKRKPVPKKKPKAKKRRSQTDDELDDSEDSIDFLDKAKLLNTISKYDLDKILEDETFDTPEGRELYKEMSPEELTIEYYERTGFECPLRFKCDPTALGMKVPPPTFTVDDVATLVDKKRLVDVITVENQGNQQMTVGDFVDYYNTPAAEKKQIYNVLSLEYEMTPLNAHIQSPDLVRKIDWIEHWPKSRRLTTFEFNKNDEFRIVARFPKVSHYCLMSPNKAYTDFHVDFGGSSVWYHVLRGSKIFFLIEPTETNLRLYEEHLMNQAQSGFLGYVVDRCVRLVIEAGQTLIIPSGWIHAVYTPADSLVFGGNFVHSLACSMQIKMVNSENRIKLGPNYRLPFFEELQFYVIANIVEKATGRKYTRPLVSAMEDAGYHETNFSNGNGQNGIGSFSLEQLTHCGQDLRGNSASSFESLQGLPKLEPETMNLEGKIPQGKIYYDEGEVEKLEGEPKIGSTAVHKLPIDEETDGIVNFDENYIQTITPRALTELFVLCTYLRSKAKVRIPEGITRPASLLNCFQQVLNYRKKDLERLSVSIPLPVAQTGRRERVLNNEDKIGNMPPKKPSSGNLKNVVNGTDSTPPEEKPKTRKPPTRRAQQKEEEQQQPDPVNNHVPFVLPDTSELNIVIPCDEKDAEGILEALEEQKEQSAVLHVDVTDPSPTLPQEETKEEQPSPEINEMVVKTPEPTTSAVIVETETLPTPRGRIPLKSKRNQSTLGTPEAKEEGKKVDDDDDAHHEEEMNRVFRKRPHQSMNESDLEDDDKPLYEHAGKKRSTDESKDMKKIVRKPPPRRTKSAKGEEDEPHEVKQESKEADVSNETEVERSKRLEREKDMKKMKKHRIMSFEDALKDPKNKAKHKKEEKPLFAHGMPVMGGKELQEARNNLYDFRPLDTITALGKAPLESAYRKSKSTKLTLLKPQANTDKYKNTAAKDCLLENLNSDEVTENNSFGNQQDSTYQEPPRSTNESFAEPLNIRFEKNVNVSTTSGPHLTPNSPGTTKFSTNPSANANFMSFSSPSPRENSKRRYSVSSTSSYGTEGQEVVKSPEELPGRFIEKRRPSYLPALKPTISPIATPISQRVNPIEKKERERGTPLTQKKSDTSASTILLSENPQAYAEERLAHMANTLLQLDAITKEMIQIDSSSL